MSPSLPLVGRDGSRSEQGGGVRSRAGATQNPDFPTLALRACPSP